MMTKTVVALAGEEFIPHTVVAAVIGGAALLYFGISVCSAYSCS